MIMRDIILSECMDILMEHGYKVSQSFGRSCFDIIAKKDDFTIILKVLKNIDSFTMEQSNELLKISYALNALPLLIGIRTRNFQMENGIVYERFHIKAITNETFKSYLEGSPPIVYAGRGGFFVNIDGETLRKIRESLNISIGELADYANVSRKTIYKYEQNQANPSVEVAIKLEEYLNAPLVRSVNLYPEMTDFNLIQDKDKYDENTENNDFKKYVINIMDDLGFNIVETKKAPFDALIGIEDYDKEQEEIGRYYLKNILLTNIDEKETEETIKKANILNKISSIVDSYSLIILEEESDTKNLNHTTIITVNDLEKMDDIVDLLYYIKKH